MLLFFFPKKEKKTTVLSQSKGSEKMKHTFIRERALSRHNCRYKDVNWYEYSEEEQQAARMPRRARTRASPPKIKRMNDEYSRRYFEWLLLNNFGAGDFHVTLTFAKVLSKEAAQRELNNYIRRLRRLYRRYGEPLDYLYVTEGKPDGAKDNPRLHYHIVLRGGPPRDEIEKLWKLGTANCDNLQPDPYEGLTALARYLMKSRKSAEKYERVWNCSQSLKRPDDVIDDNSVSRKRMRKLQTAARNDEVKRYLERIYIGWIVLSAEVGTNEVTGRPYAHIRLIRRERYGHYIKLYKAVKGKSPPNSQKKPIERI